MRIIGIDPGLSGGIACIFDDGKIAAYKMPDTEHDTAELLAELVTEASTRAVLEAVHAMPKQGVASTFKFGRSYGFLRGLLVALAIPFEDVSPVKWQTAMGCRSGGDKNVTNAAAQRLWPSMKWTHATADAALIAEWLRRKNV